MGRWSSCASLFRLAVVTDPMLGIVKKGLLISSLLVAMCASILFFVWGNTLVGWLLVGIPWVVGMVVGLLVARAGAPDTPKEPPLSTRSGAMLGGLGVALAAFINSDKVMSIIGAVCLTLMVAGFFAMLGRYIQIKTASGQSSTVE